jgi:hypothetical protein
MVWRLGVTAGAESWHWSVGPRRGAARQQRCVHPCALRGGGGRLGSVEFCVHPCALRVRRRRGGGARAPQRAGRGA